MIQVRPTLSEVLAHEAGAHTHVALTAEVIVDGFTPVALFAALAGDRPGAFLLESVEGGELLGRYSFMGFDVERRVVPEPGDTFGAIHRRLAERRVWSSVPLPRFAGGVVGFVGFDAISELEPVPLSERPGVSIPSAGLLLTDEVLVYDHAGHRLSVIVHAALDGDRAAAYAAARARIEAIIARIGSASSALSAWTEAEIDVDALPVRANVSKADFEGAVERAKQAIVAGEVFQVVLSQRLTVDVSVEPFELYRTLRTTNPSPYMFYLAFDDFALVGASPEVLVRREDERLFLRPIAGTRPRGRTPVEDLQLEAELLADEKERAEHRMLLDLGRNDLGRIARPGTVRVDDPLHVERYAHVMHIVSDVHAESRERLDGASVLAACFPAGTVSGAPKLRACELIAELEPDRRGPYAGAVGYFDYAGHTDTCIAIRTMLVQPGQVHLQAGAGIVHDSQPEREYEECLHKARSGLVAIARTLARAQAEPEGGAR